MDATAWTVVGAAIAILAAIGASFRSLRDEMRTEMRAQGDRIEAQGKGLSEQIGQLREQIGQLRERMAHLEGLLDGLREAISSKRGA